jgi:hypothetical protein
MKKWIYNKLASVKNKNIFCREIGSRIRRYLMWGDIRSRRTAMIDIGGGHGPKLSREKGYHVYDEREMPLEWTSEVVCASREILHCACREELNEKAGGGLYTGLLSANDITEGSVYMKFALQKKIINLVSEYLGIVPVLAHVGVWYSPRNSEKSKGSQLFHLDQADVRQVKVFVYCSDVCDDDGPLTVIDASKSREIARKIDYDYSDSGQCVQDDIITEHVDSNRWVKAIGAKGTVVIADTSSCFHLGSRTTEHSSDRLVAVFQYLSPTAFTLPWDYHSKLPCADLNCVKASDQSKMVLGIR